MRSYDVDPDQAVSIAAIFMFVDAAFTGFPLLSSMVNGGVLPWIGRDLVLVAGLIAGGVGLLKGLRWGWYVSIAAIGLQTLLDLATLRLFGLLIDALVIFLLTRPATRAKFGVR